VLQSPHFVYRVELGEAMNGVLYLTPHELASRLSYALWNTMPDDALFKAADDRSLVKADVLAAQATRMLDDERAKPMLADFHEKLFHLDHVDGIKKDTAVFPEWTDDMAKMMRHESELFVMDVVSTQNKGLTELLTADYTFANDKLAAIYGVAEKPGTELKKVKLDPAQRAGLLTQTAFLASHASARQHDPIHRGVMINLQIICADLPPPPMNVPPLPAPVAGETMRERVTRHTGVGTCGGACHGTKINPAGFAFEHYDALGKWRTTDNGKPVNARDKYPFKDGTFEYDGAVAFAKVLAARPQVHSCYTGNLLEFTLGRRRAANDAALVDATGKSSLEGEPTKKLILKLITAPTFVARPIARSN
jgi:hypothetical protein